jgi:predicted nucleic acid-binding protein
VPDQADPLLSRSLVLDANILVRAVLGQRVLDLIERYAGRVMFFTPDTAFAEARRHLPAIADKRGIDSQPVLAALSALEDIVGTVDVETYEAVRDDALARIQARDPNDWPVLACALLLRQPIWTEDRDFFGVGVATWTTDRRRDLSRRR